MKTRKETILFLVALFAILLAGDMIWWQAVQISVDFDESVTQWATIYANVNGPDADIERAGQKLEEEDLIIDQEVKNLEKELNNIELQ